MSIYFLVHDGAFFHRQVKPALSASWRQRSFEPCRALCASLVPAAQAFAERYHTGPDEPVLSRLGHGLPFDRDIGRYLVGEIFLVAAQEIPEIQTAPDTLCRLLAPDRCGEGEIPRPQFAPIQQAHFGTRDLVFAGGYYRPDQAGWNDVP